MSEYKETGIRQKQILDLALSIIEHDGLDGLTMKRIAHGLDLVPSAIYRHFSGKEQLLESLVGQIQGKLLLGLKQSVQKVEGSDYAQSGQGKAFEILDEVVNLHINLLESSSGVVKLVFGGFAFSSVAGRRKRILKLLTAYRKGISEVLKKGQDDALIRTDLRADSIALTFISMFQSAALMKHLQNGRFKLREYVNQAWQIQKQGLMVQATDSRNKGGRD